jgi:hypothetical protein
MGHLKTVLVLGGGFLLFDTDASLNNIVGVGMAFMGCLIYAFVKDREMRRALQQQEDRVAVGDGVK